MRTGILILMLLTGASCGVEPERDAPPPTGAAAPVVPSEVSFPTQDGGVTQADVYGQGDRGLILVHGGRFTKESWASQAAILARAGFRVVAINLRGRCASRGGPGWNGPGDEHGIELDVLAAVRSLRETGAQSVSIVGASLGGWATASAAVAAERGAIDRIVLMAAAPIDEPERMQGRKLFITTREDSRGEGILRLPSIRDQFERATGPKQLVILEGSAHAQFIFETEQSARLLREILDFLSSP